MGYLIDRIVGDKLGERVRIRARTATERALRKPLNAFAKSVTSDAKRRGLISNDTMHELDGIIDRRLWPERHRA